MIENETDENKESDTNESKSAEIKKNVVSQEVSEESVESISTNGVGNKNKKKKTSSKYEGVPRELLGLFIDMDWCKKSDVENHGIGSSLNSKKGSDYYRQSKEINKSNQKQDVKKVSNSNENKINKDEPNSNTSDQPSNTNEKTSTKDGKHISDSCKDKTHESKRKDQENHVISSNSSPNKQNSNLQKKDYKPDSDPAESEEKINQDEARTNLRRMLKTNNLFLEMFMKLTKYPFNKEKTLVPKKCVIFYKMKPEEKKHSNHLELNKDIVKGGNFYVYRGLYVIDNVSDSGEVEFSSMNDVNENISRYITITGGKEHINQYLTDYTPEIDEKVPLACLVFDDLGLYWSGNRINLCLIFKNIPNGKYKFISKVNKNKSKTIVETMRVHKLCCNISQKNPKKFKNDVLDEVETERFEDYWCIIFEDIEGVVNPYLFKVSDPNLIRKYDSKVIEGDSMINKVLKDIILTNFNIKDGEDDKEEEFKLDELKMQFCNIDKTLPQTFDNSNCLMCLLTIQFVTGNSRYFPDRSNTTSRVKSSNMYVNFKISNVLKQSMIVPSPKSRNKNQEKGSPKKNLAKKQVVEEELSNDDSEESKPEEDLTFDAVHRMTRRMVKELHSVETTPDSYERKKVKKEKKEQRNKRSISNISTTPASSESEDKSHEKDKEPEEQPKKKKLLTTTSEKTVQVTKVEKQVIPQPKLVQATDSQSGFQFVGSLIKYSDIDKDQYSKKGREWTYGVIKYWDPKYKAFFVHCLNEEFVKSTSDAQVYRSLKEQTNDHYSDRVMWISTQSNHVIAIGDDPVFVRPDYMTENENGREADCSPKDTQESSSFCKVCNKRVVYLRKEFYDIPDSTDSTDYDDTYRLSDFIAEAQTTYDYPNYLFRNPVHSTVLALREMEQIGLNRVIKILEKNMDITKIFFKNYKRENIKLYNKSTVYFCLKIIIWFRKQCKITQTVTPESKLKLVYWGFKCSKCNKLFHAKCLQYQHLRKPSPQMNKENVNNRLFQHRAMCKNFRGVTNLRSSYYSNENLYTSNDFKLDLGSDDELFITHAQRRAKHTNYYCSIKGEPTDNESEQLDESNSTTSIDNKLIKSEEASEEKDDRELYVYYPMLDSSDESNEWVCPDCKTCVYCCLPMTGRSYISALNYCYGFNDSSMKSYRQFPPCFEQKVDQLQRNCLKTDMVKDVVCVSCNISAHRACCNPVVPSLIFIESWKCDYCTQCISCGYRDATFSEYLNWGLFFYFCLKCWELLERSNYCGICYKVWTNFDTASQKWVQCEGCKLWIHVECDDLARLITDCPSSRNQNYRCYICRSEDKIYRCTKALEQIFIVDKLNQFRYPVSPTFVTYWRLVTKPMNLVTLFTKLESGKYNTIAEFIFDVFLIPYNAKTVNMPNTKIYKFAMIFERKCYQIINTVMQITDSEIDVIIENGLSGGNVIAKEKKLIVPESQGEEVGEDSKEVDVVEEKDVEEGKEEYGPRLLKKLDIYKPPKPIEEERKKILNFNLTFELLLSKILTIEVKPPRTEEKKNDLIPQGQNRFFRPPPNSKNNVNEKPIRFKDISEFFDPYVPCGQEYAVASVISVVSQDFVIPPTFNESEDFEELVKSKKLIMLNRNNPRNPYLLWLVQSKENELDLVYLDKQENLNKLSNTLFTHGFVQVYDSCAVCGSNAYQSYFVYCENCAEPMHYYCAGFMFPPGYVKYSQIYCAACDQCRKCLEKVKSNHPYELANVKNYRFVEAIGFIPGLITNLVLHSSQIMSEKAMGIDTDNNSSANESDEEEEEPVPKAATFLDGRFTVNHTGEIYNTTDKDPPEPSYFPFNNVKCVTCGKSAHLSCIRMVGSSDQLNSSILNKGLSLNCDNSGTEVNDFVQGQESPSYLKDLGHTRDELFEKSQNLTKNLEESGMQSRAIDNVRKYLGRTTIRDIPGSDIQELQSSNSGQPDPPPGINYEGSCQVSASRRIYKYEELMRNIQSDLLHEKINRPIYSDVSTVCSYQMHHPEPSVFETNAESNDEYQPCAEGTSNDKHQPQTTQSLNPPNANVSQTNTSKEVSKMAVQTLMSNYIPIMSHRSFRNRPQALNDNINSTYMSYAQVISTFDEPTEEEADKRFVNEMKQFDYSLNQNLGWEFDGSGIFSCSNKCFQKYHMLKNFNYKQESLYTMALMAQFDQLQEYYNLIPIECEAKDYHTTRIREQVKLEIKARKEESKKFCFKNSTGQEVYVSNNCIVCGIVFKTPAKLSSFDIVDRNSKSTGFILPDSSGVWVMCPRCEAYDKYMDSLSCKIKPTNSESKLNGVKESQTKALETISSENFINLLNLARKWVLTGQVTSTKFNTLQSAINYIITILSTMAPDFLSNMEIKGVVYKFINDADRSLIYPHIYNGLSTSPVSPIAFTEWRESLVRYCGEQVSDDLDPEDEEESDEEEDYIDYEPGSTYRSLTRSHKTRSSKDESVNIKRSLLKLSHHMMIKRFTTFVSRITRFHWIYKDLLSHKIFFKNLKLSRDYIQAVRSNKGNNECLELISSRLQKLFELIVDGNVNSDIVSNRQAKKFPHFRRHLAHLIFSGEILSFNCAGSPTKDNWVMKYTEKDLGSNSPSLVLGKIGYEAEAILWILTEFVNYSKSTGNKKVVDSKAQKKSQNSYKKVFWAQNGVNGRSLPNGNLTEVQKASLFDSQFSERPNPSLDISKLLDALKTMKEEIKSQSNFEDLEQFLLKFMGSSFLVDVVSARAITGDVVLKERLDGGKLHTDFSNSKDNNLRPAFSSQLRANVNVSKNLEDVNHFVESKTLNSCCLCGVPESTLLRGQLLPWRNGHVHSECVLWSVSDAYLPRTYNVNYDNFYTVFDPKQYEDFTEAQPEKTVDPSVILAQMDLLETKPLETSKNSTEVNVEVEKAVAQDAEGQGVVASEVKDESKDVEVTFEKNVQQKVEVKTEQYQETNGIYPQPVLEAIKKTVKPADNTPERANINLLYMPLLPPVQITDSVMEAVYKSSMESKCKFCTGVGATVMCSGQNCNVAFHLCCAFMASSKLVHRLYERDEPEKENESKVFPVKMFYTRRKLWCATCFQYILNNVMTYHIKSIAMMKRNDIKSFFALEGLSTNAIKIVFRQTMQPVRIIPRTIDYKKLDIFMCYTSKTFNVIKSSYIQTMLNHVLEEKITAFIENVFKPDGHLDNPNKIHTDFDFKFKYFLYGTDKDGSSIYSLKVPCLTFSEGVTHNTWKIGSLTLLNIGDALMLDKKGVFYPVGFTSVRRYWNNNHFKKEIKEEERGTGDEGGLEEDRVTEDGRENLEEKGLDDKKEELSENGGDLELIFSDHNITSNKAFDPERHLGTMDRSYYLCCVRSLDGEPYFTIDLISEPCTNLPNIRLVQGRDFRDTFAEFRKVIGMENLNVSAETFFGLNLHIVLQQIRYELCSTMMHRTTQLCKTAAFKQSVLGSKVSNIDVSMRLGEPKVNTPGKLNKSFMLQQRDDQKDPRGIDQPVPTKLSSIFKQGAEVADSRNNRSRSKKQYDLSNPSTQYRYLLSIPPEQRLDVKPSIIHGLGLFAKDSIGAGEPVVEYVGELIRDVVGDQREELYSYGQGGDGSCYMFRLDDQYIVDATRQGNMSRFINHSCDPNCLCRIITCENGMKHIVVFAKLDLNPGDEVTYDYQFGVESETRKLMCLCGAPNCLGRMN